MKKGALVLILLIAIFMVGCGKTDVKNSNEPQTMESEKDSDTETRDWDDYMTSVKEKSDRIKVSLENDELTQTEMNIKSQELYELWDGALNDMWSELKLSLSEEELKIVEPEYISAKVKSVASRIENVRQIAKIIEEYIGMRLVNALIDTKAAEELS